MRKTKILTIFLTMIGSVAYAQGDSDVSALNTAWNEYVAALEQPLVDVKIDAAEALLVAGRKVFEPTDERLPVMMTNYGIALFAGHRKEEARDVLKEALSSAEKIHGKDSIALVSVLTHLADAESEVFSSGRQLKYYKRALRIVATQHGKDSDEYSDLAYKAGYSVLRYSDSSAGRKYFLEAQEISESRHGKLSDRYGLATFHLAKIAYSKRQFDKAAEYALAALPAFAGEEEKQIDSQLFTRALLVKAYEAKNKTDLATEHCIEIGKISALRPKEDYLPLFRMAPRYPVELLEDGIEAHVDLSFTIDKNGFVQQVQVTDSVATRGGRPTSLSGPKKRALQTAALNATERFRYAPKFVDGEVVETESVKTRITFALE